KPTGGDKHTGFDRETYRSRPVHNLPVQTGNHSESSTKHSEVDDEVSPSGSPSALRATGSPGGFEGFFAVFPRQGGKQEGRVEFNAALLHPGVTPETLVRKAVEYAAATAHKDPQYIKCPDSWLRKKCWEENPRPPKPKAPRGNTAKQGAGATGSDRKAKGAE